MLVRNFRAPFSKVYTLSAREVIKLVDEEKPAGHYKSEWNGANYPSGVYFYWLKAGDYVSTKSILLLK